MGTTAARSMLGITDMPMCAHSMTRSGEPGSFDERARHFAQNDLPAGGFPQVTVKVGQDFTTKRCGTWVKK